MNEPVHQAGGTAPRSRESTDGLGMLETAIGHAAAAESPVQLAELLSAAAHEIAVASVAVVLHGKNGSAVEARDGRAVESRLAAARGWREAGRAVDLVGARSAEWTAGGADTGNSAVGSPVVQRLPLIDAGRVVGSMVVEYATEGSYPGEDRQGLVRALAAAAGPLAGRLRDRLDRGSGAAQTGRPSDAARAERMRIARELHDGLIQSLYGMGLLIRTQAERTDLPEKGRQRMRGWVKRIDDLVDEATAYISGLEVSGDAMIDLGAGIDAIAEEAAAAGLDVSTEVDSTDDARLSHEICHEVLVVAREAASNTIRHAQAHRIAIRVDVDTATGTVTLTVEDDGDGYEPARHRSGGHGLDNMAARAAALAGSLDVTSRRYGGTRVRLRVPMHSPAGGRAATSELSTAAPAKESATASAGRPSDGGADG